MLWLLFQKFVLAIVKSFFMAGGRQGHFCQGYPWRVLACLDASRRVNASRSRVISGHNPIVVEDQSLSMESRCSSHIILLEIFPLHTVFPMSLNHDPAWDKVIAWTH